MLKGEGWHKKKDEQWDWLLRSDAAALYQANKFPLTFEMRRFVEVETRADAQVRDDWWWRPYVGTKWQRWARRAVSRPDGEPMEHLTFCLEAGPKGLGAFCLEATA